MTIQVSLSQLASVQKVQDRIRNVCILAHVDHGKTTLSDHLIGANGLIHPKMAGELRYLDAREDEQARGITMKSSAISLMHIPGREQAVDADGRPLRKAVGDGELGSAYLVNLIDSPGHVDFCSEVSTAVRLCDGALVVVDCVEGVCIQTHAVLRQAFQERVTPVLVLNKIDRLILEQQLTPMEAYDHLVRIIGDVNNVVSSFQSESHLKEADDNEEREGSGEGPQEDAATAAQEDEELTFSPDKGNVAFASAADGWGFRVVQFAHMVAAKLNAKPQALQRALWGNYYFQAKTKSVTRKRPATGKAVPMFVQFVLEPLWKAYSAVDPDTDAAALLSKMVESLALKVSEKDVQRSDKKAALKTVLRAWLPLSEAVLGMATEHLPSPPEAAPSRLPRLMPPPPELPELPEAAAMVGTVRAAVGACSSALHDPVVVYVSKMVSVPAATLPRNPGDPSPGPGEVFLAFGRVFSGVVRQGQRLHVMSAAYNPARPDAGQRRTAVVRAVYLMMGTGLERLPGVPAGNVLALEGFEETILKTATLSSTPASPSMAPMTFQAAPVVRVAVEPALPSEIMQLRRGLELLNKADPMVEVMVLDTGEFVLGTAGEVHLETCIKDLQERFARIKLEVSPPLVAFRESVADFAEEAKADSGISSRPVRCVEATTANGVCTLRVRVLPIPNKLAEALEFAGQELRQAADPAAANDDDLSEAAKLKERLENAVEDCEDGKRALQRIGSAWSLGPKNTGPNVLMGSTADAKSLWSLPAASVVNLSAGKQQKQAGASGGDPGSPAEGKQDSEQLDWVRVPLGRAAVAQKLGLVNAGASPGPAGEAEQVPEGLRAPAGAVESGILSGFQMASAAGPLCDEPMWGVAFEVEARLNTKEGETAGLAEDVYGPFSGQVTSTAKDAFRRALIEAGPRLVEAMYLCEVATSSEALAGVYAALGRRRSRILSEDMREGSDTFIIQASLPVEASFGFAAEIRRRGKGAESPSLMFSHWERLQIDPYFVPTTEEEREEFGEQGQGFTEPNLAKRFIDQVRRRKGIMVEEKIVESATKQRTLARKV